MKFEKKEVMRTSYEFELVLTREEYQFLLDVYRKISPGNSDELRIISLYLNGTCLNVRCDDFEKPNGGE